jgi:hypothetical protein
MDTHRLDLWVCPSAACSAPHDTKATGAPDRTTIAWCQDGLMARSELQLIHRRMMSENAREMFKLPHRAVAAVATAD